MISRTRSRALATQQPQTENIGTHTSDETHMMTYQLNKEKAMKKKLKACSRQEPVILEQTNGGLRMHLQTGMYEAMRHAIAPYYGGEATSNEVETSKTIVDATKNVVGETIRIKNRQTGIIAYVINMYHTTSSMLINGVDEEAFLRRDLTGLISEINTTEKYTGMSARSLNVYMKKILTEYGKQIASPRRYGSDHVENTVPRKKPHHEVEGTAPRKKPHKKAFPISNHTKTTSTSCTSEQLSLDNCRDRGVEHDHENVCTICDNPCHESSCLCETADHWVHYACDGRSPREIEQFRTQGPTSYMCRSCHGQTLQVGEGDGQLTQDMCDTTECDGQLAQDKCDVTDDEDGTTKGTRISILGSTAKAPDPSTVTLPASSDIRSHVIKLSVSTPTQSPTVYASTQPSTVRTSSTTKVATAPSDTYPLLPRNDPTAEVTPAICLVRDVLNAPRVTMAGCPSTIMPSTVCTPALTISKLTATSSGAQAAMPTSVAARNKVAKPSTPLLREGNRSATVGSDGVGAKRKKTQTRTNPANRTGNDGASDYETQNIEEKRATLQAWDTELKARERAMGTRERAVKQHEREVIEQSHQIATMKSLIVKLEEDVRTLKEENRMHRLRTLISSDPSVGQGPPSGPAQPHPITTPIIPQHIDVRPASESIGIRVLEKQIEMQNDIERLKETTALAARGYCGLCPHVSRGITHPQPAPCMAHHGYSCGHNIQALHHSNQVFEDHGPVYSHHMHVPHHPNQMVEDLGHGFNHPSHSMHAPHHPNQVPEDRDFKRYTYHHPTHSLYRQRNLPHRKYNRPRYGTNYPKSNDKQEGRVQHTRLQRRREDPQVFEYGHQRAPVVRQRHWESTRVEAPMQASCYDESPRHCESTRVTIPTQPSCLNENDLPAVNVSSQLTTAAERGMGNPLIVMMPSPKKISDTEVFADENKRRDISELAYSGDPSRRTHEHEILLTATGCSTTSCNLLMDDPQAYPKTPLYVGLPNAIDSSKEDNSQGYQKTPLYVNLSDTVKYTKEVVDTEQNANQIYEKQHNVPRTPTPLHNVQHTTNILSPDSAQEGSLSFLALSRSRDGYR